MDKIEFLRGTPLFGDLDDDELRFVVSVLKVAHYEPAEVVFVEGDDADAAYIVIEGEVKLSKRIALDVDKTVFVARAGDVFGEMGMLEREPRSATAEAAKPTELVWIGAELFERMARERPAVGAKVLAQLARLLSARLRHTTNLYSAATMWGLEISGATRLHFHDLIREPRSLRFLTRSGAVYDGRIVRVDRDSRDLTIETADGELVMLSYQGLDAVHLGRSGDLVEAAAARDAALARATPSATPGGEG